ncbi:D-tyrosyl-tRNA(Tyr) deacylase [Methanosarcina sp. 2.H.T.1A.6]|uniref:D-aminoacyl-tRNA deacylase n=1 Tax=unclassified Methanosarcina TaxID=2644672 RepID=UPI000621A70C|nr:MULTISPECIES: D-aminoacyl-tRNA deacylase [unclassified Methanosarcina]KKG16772.1 D-tyrosyl-tRNA(Tyr) deacylase [Methanosarcina sp. 2.H.T.1A.3]KKG22768.1 D-tyrosyl-tRNA(Tyr) deacylase [Methanosarcina sp. 2.H.T.1A.6]KKG22938.1 D-tyrosyl-tRNA(Tyr) deacylase [Methanosarcina sp. 2.H.T.1A.15]KKG24501.1 D-tyrosyl-tRNA(Tyr) deacylase [Methanosarcina sp. 2.H.T.1A.8]
MTDISKPENVNNSKITIICSAPDLSSQNIKTHLLRLREWKPLELPPESGFSAARESADGKFRLVDIEEIHVFQDGLDKKLEAAGLPASLIIFASKHRSKEEINSLTVHCTGNSSGEARLGGLPKSLAVASPAAMKSILSEMKRLVGEKGLKYDVTLEVTHHGPTELSVPSIYAEIGSTEVQWTDPEAGEVAAKAILAVSLEKVPVAVGFGGGHYAMRQTGLLLETDISFGHNFPKYQLEFVDEALVRQAVEKSNAEFAYFDRKSMKSEDKKRISEILEKLGLKVLKESEIREKYGREE